MPGAVFNRAGISSQPQFHPAGCTKVHERCRLRALPPDWLVPAEATQPRDTTAPPLDCNLLGPTRSGGHYLVPACLPTLKSSSKMMHIPKSLLLEYLQRPRAPPARRAVHHILSIPVQRGQSIRKVVRPIVQVRRTGDVPSRILSRRSNVQHHHVTPGNHPCRLLQIHIHNPCRRPFLHRSARLGATCSQERRHQNSGDPRSTQTQDTATSSGCRTATCPSRVCWIGPAGNRT
jgi:hypothetical protein